MMLLSTCEGFADLIKEYLSEADEEDEKDDEVGSEINEFKTSLLRRISIVSGSDVADALNRRMSIRRSRRKSTRVDDTRFGRRDRKDDRMDEKPDKLIHEEQAEEGGVSWSVYKAYFKALGLGITMVSFIAYLCYIGGGVGTNVWLSQWTNDAGPNVTNITRLEKLPMRIGAYFGIGIFQMLSILIHCVSLSFGTARYILSGYTDH
jgi:hypothetical protein